MELIIDSKHFCIIRFGSVFYLKIFGFQTTADIAPLVKIFREFGASHKGEHFVGYCDLSETILSEPQTALKINEAITELSNNINIDCVALIFLDAFSSYKYEFAKLFYLRGLKFPNKAFTNKTKALNYIAKHNHDISEITLFLAD